MQPASDTLERLVPDRLDARDTTGRATLELHLARYRFAAARLRPGRALDLACGVGYGAQLLADARADVDVLGVDVSPDAVAYARERYAGPRLAFRAADALAFDDADGFDSVVSLETVEHVDDPGALVARLAALVRPGGVLVASVPTTPSVDWNPHHRHDFTERSFRLLVAARAPGLVAGDALRQVQPVSLRALLARRERRMGDLRRSPLAYYAAQPGAALRRALATLRWGLTNRYVTIAWRRPGPSG